VCRAPGGHARSHQCSNRTGLNVAVTRGLRGDFSRCSEPKAIASRCAKTTATLSTSSENGDSHLTCREARTNRRRPGTRFSRSLRSTGGNIRAPPNHRHVRQSFIRRFVNSESRWRYRDRPTAETTDGSRCRRKIGQERWKRNAPSPNSPTPPSRASINPIVSSSCGPEDSSTAAGGRTARTATPASFIRRRTAPSTASRHRFADGAAGTGLWCPLRVCPRA